MAFKTFVAGDVLTAAEVNTYLAKQAVIVCTAATRPSSPVEGMTIYETDTNRSLVYDGSNWVQPSGPIKVLGTLTGVAGAAPPNPDTSPIPFRVQGGTIVVTAAAGGVVVTYPTAFPTGVLTVVVTQGDSDAAVAQITLVYAAHSTSSFKVQFYAHGGGELTSGARRINWIAIGF